MQSWFLDGRQSFFYLHGEWNLEQLNADLRRWAVTEVIGFAFGQICRRGYVLTPFDDMSTGTVEKWGLFRKWPLWGNFYKQCVCFAYHSYLRYAWVWGHSYMNDYGDVRKCPTKQGIPHCCSRFVNSPHCRVSTKPRPCRRAAFCHNNSADKRIL